MTSTAQQIEYSLASLTWGYHSLWVNNFHEFAYHLRNSGVSIQMNLWVDQCLLYIMWIEWGPVQSPVELHMWQHLLLMTQLVDKRIVIYQWDTIWTREAHHHSLQTTYTSCEAICHDQQYRRPPKDPVAILAQIYLYLYHQQYLRTLWGWQFPWNAPFCKQTGTQEADHYSKDALPTDEE